MSQNDPTEFEDYETADEGGAGRPSLFTPKLAARIAEEVRRGAKPLRAAAACGVKRPTWYRWLEKAENREQPYAMLMGTILLAQDSFEAMQEQAIASAPEWQARAWILKTRHRKEYGDKMDVGVDDKREPAQLSRAELLAIAYGNNDEG